MSFGQQRPRVIVEAPSEFLDGEDWVFDLTFRDPLTGLPMNLTGATSSHRSPHEH